MTRKAADPGLTSNAETILDHARSTVSAFDKAFETVRTARGVTIGAPRDEEQDLLRAALVLAAAGLDSLTKYLIRDTVPTLLKTEKGVREQFEKFIGRRLQGGTDASEGLVGSRFLSRVLAAPNTQDQLIEEYINELTGGSLQSVDELFRISSALDIDPAKVGIDAKTLRPVFAARNQIIHELDIDLAGKRRKRRKRTKATMLADADKLLAVGQGLIDEIKSKIGAVGTEK